MPYTNCKVRMELADVSAALEASPQSLHNAKPGSIELIKEQKEYPDFWGMDLNSFIVDGSKAVLQDGDKIPFVSQQISKKDCTFAENPSIDVTFEGKHTSAGITLYFIEDYPAELKITWYSAAGSKLAEEKFLPDKMDYFCRCQVEGYSKITIEFYKTRLPGKRVRLGYIKYGLDMEWIGDILQKVSLEEEVDSTSATIPINTAQVSIVDKDGDFQLGNQEGMWKSIQKKQAFHIMEELGTKSILCGVLFVDSWKSQNNIVSFSLIDRMGVLDKTRFYEGKIYENVPAGTIIDEIMQSAGTEAYTVAEEIRKISLNGYLPVCTHRQALQQVVFACGAVADCSRSGNINIFMPDRYADSTIGMDRRFIGTSIEVGEYVSGVSVAYQTYTLKAESEEICKDVLPAGISKIEFSAPYTGLAVSAGTIVEAKTNYITVNMSAEQKCVITGKKYEANEITYTVNVPVLEAGEEENILTFGSCTLFNAERVKAVAERLLNYYQLRQIVTMRYLLDSEKTGDWVNIRDAGGKTITTGITSQSIDLTGGFIAQAVCRGYSKVVTENAYTGEIYAGERGLI